SLSCRSKANIEITVNENKKIPNTIKYSIRLIPKSDSYSCATTSAAMAISYFNDDDRHLLNKDTVWEISGSSIEIATKKGFELHGLERIANYYNYKYDFFENMTFTELEYLLSNGALVVLFIRLNKQSIHAVLVTGYNRHKKELSINDCSQSMTHLTYSYLDKYWNAYFADLHKNVKRAGFIIYPKDYKFQSMIKIDKQ
ncbi:MAG: C39 family peptidase, partial [Ignavibacteriales bacterium]|nr:C39 family peptidase [Ignavibacteriales bacterium]